ncbi:hypothetical protein D918_01794 [Trichuris suis]|nr:hypothetical protein D918_01794 [Trichuris suis]
MVILIGPPHTRKHANQMRRFSSDDETAKQRQDDSGNTSDEETEIEEGSTSQNNSNNFSKQSFINAKAEEANAYTAAQQGGAMGANEFNGNEMTYRDESASESITQTSNCEVKSKEDKEESGESVVDILIREMATRRQQLGYSSESDDAETPIHEDPKEVTEKY